MCNVLRGHEGVRHTCRCSEDSSSTGPMPGKSTSRRGSVGGQEGVGEGQEGIYRSSLDARKPQNPINSEEYQGYIFKVCCTVREGHKSPKR